MTPDISVIVPIYNTEKYLRQCVDSVLTQEGVDIELILVDDGSSDSSIDIIKSYVTSDQRVHGYFIKGRGPSEPRNYGLEQAHGRYLYFLDSDDFLPDAHSLKALFDVAERYSNVSLVKGSHKVLKPDGEIVSTSYAPQRAIYDNKILDGEEFLAKLINGHNIPCNLLIRKSFVDQHGITFHADMCFLEDGPFLYEFFSYPTQAVYISTETYVYRLLAEGSVTNTKLTPAKVESAILGVKYFRNLVGKYNSSSARDSLSVMISNYAYSSLESLCRFNKQDSERLFKLLKGTINKIPVQGSRINRLVSSIYNFNPRAAYSVCRIINVLFNRQIH